MMRYLFIILLFPLSIFAECINCPKGKTLQGGIGAPQNAFTGYTSAVDSFDGAAPNCFIIDGINLNSVIAGIDVALCELKQKADSINIYWQQDNAYIQTIDSIYNEINKIYSTVLVNTDGTINISSFDSLGTTYWDLVLDIDSVVSLINANINYECLDANAPACDTLLTSEFQKLIDNVALLYAPQVDTCVAWDFYCNVSTQQFDSTTIFTIEPLSDTILGTPPNMCLMSIQYIFNILNSNGDFMSNILVNVPATLGITTSVKIPWGYAYGVDSIDFIARFNKYQCQSNVQCGYYDYTESISITGP